MISLYCLRQDAQTALQSPARSPLPDAAPNAEPMAVEADDGVDPSGMTIAQIKAWLVDNNHDGKARAMAPLPTCAICLLEVNAFVGLTHCFARNRSGSCRRAMPRRPTGWRSCGASCSQFLLEPASSCSTTDIAHDVLPCTNVRSRREVEIMRCFETPRVA